MENEQADLLYGAPAIAEYLKIPQRTVYHLVETGGLPAFRLGGKLCARRETIATWLAEQDAAGRAPAGPPKAHTEDSESP